jgi:hypothetical protein
MAPIDRGVCEIPSMLALIDRSFNESSLSLTLIDRGVDHDLCH